MLILGGAGKDLFLICLPPPPHSFLIWPLLLLLFHFPPLQLTSERGDVVDCLEDDVQLGHVVLHAHRGHQLLQPGICEI